MGYQRRGRKLFYYRSIRQNGKVKKIYFGSGPAAEKAAAEDAARRKAVIESRQEKERLNQAAALSSEFVEATALLIEATLFAEGYHLHDRTWRRRRAGS